MATCFASNTEQPTCRNGHYATVLYWGKHIDRVECNHPSCTHDKHTLWREANRLSD